VVHDIAKALAVLAMSLLLLGASPPDLSSSASLVQQAGALGTAYTQLCGNGHDQAPLACHAPNSCCRPDHLLLPPRELAPDPAYAVAERVTYAARRWTGPVAAAISAFRSRAPPR
jgi:hypothetical protein